MLFIPLMLDVNEGDGIVEVCVMLASLNSTEREVIVTLTPDTGTGKFRKCHVCIDCNIYHCTATDADYISSALVVTISAGSDGQCIGINITNDMALEFSENFILTLTTTDPDVLLGNSETIIQITDDDGKSGNQ